MEFKSEKAQGFRWSIYFIDNNRMELTAWVQKQVDWLFFGRWKMKAFLSDGFCFLRGAILTCDGEGGVYFNKFWAKRNI